jgi:hypothetical protein
MRRNPPSDRIDIEDHCGFVPNLESVGLTYAMRPLPALGALDLSAVFLRRDAFVKENLRFGR